MFPQNQQMHLFRPFVRLDALQVAHVTERDMFIQDADAAKRRAERDVQAYALHLEAALKTATQPRKAGPKTPAKTAARRKKGG